MACLYIHLINGIWETQRTNITSEIRPISKRQLIGSPHEEADMASERKHWQYSESISRKWSAIGSQEKSI